MVWLGVPHAPAGATTLIVSLGLLRTPEQLAILMLAVVLLLILGFLINRLAGLPYPIWAPRGAGPGRPERASIHRLGGTHPAGLGTPGRASYRRALRAHRLRVRRRPVARESRAAATGSPRDSAAGPYRRQSAALLAGGSVIQSPVPSVEVVAHPDPVINGVVIVVF